MASSLASRWVFLLLLCNPILLLLGAVTDEGVALLSFKESIIEDPEGSLANWDSSHQHHCSWNGITCKQGTVISISLPKRRLMGSIPPALGSLRSLRHLNLRDNLLNGTLPPELSGAPKLQSLVLYGNSLSGSLPPEIGTLHSLQTLDLSHNSFSGPIPPDLIQCKRLKTLDFSRNNFSSSLPTGFGINFDVLARLDLSYNRLGGSIPADIGSLSSLRGTADFSHNFFSGPIPASLGNLPETVYIDLTYNNLTGPIPQSGTLMNGGPTAFIGNPGLCGPPLKTPCSSSEPAIGSFLPSNYPTTVSDEEGDGCRSSNNGASLSRNSVIVIVASDLIGIGLIAVVVFYCCKRATNSSKGEQGGDNFDKGSKGGKECMCFTKDKSETLSENVQQQSDLVPLDHQVGFDLDALLRASAFILGKSGIGTVYKVVLEDGQTLAVRRLGEGGLQRLTEFQAEVEAIGKVRHPNIATLRAYYWSTDERLLIYDYLPNGNISKAIHGTAGESVDLLPLTWESRLKIMKGIAKGLAFLHEFSPKKYIHGDLKPSNILLGLNMEPCISDFGLGRLTNIAGGSPLLQSNRIPNGNPQNAVMSSTSCYQAPEIPKALKPSQKWDVYSYGAILLELISGKPPDLLLGTSEMDLARWVQLCVEEKKPLSDVVDPFLTRELESEDEIIAILRISLACVQANPDKRPSMRHIVDALNKLTRGCDDH